MPWLFFFFSLTVICEHKELNSNKTFKLKKKERIAKSGLENFENHFLVTLSLSNALFDEIFMSKALFD